MPRYAYDRLSAQDNNFLLWERGNVCMHIASLLVCDAGPLRRQDGGIDIDTVKRATEGYLHRVLRYRQRVKAIPLFDHYAWVDDPHFDIDYHVRHTSLGSQALSGPINTIVTNVPGPQVPLYFHGARVRNIYPMVPLMEGMGIGIAVTSYAGTMNFGFNADPDIVPNLGLFTDLVREALGRAAREAGVTLTPPEPEPTPVAAPVAAKAPRAPLPGGNGRAVNR